MRNEKKFINLFSLVSAIATIGEVAIISSGTKTSVISSLKNKNNSIINNINWRTW